MKKLALLFFAGLMASSNLLSAQGFTDYEWKGDMPKCPEIPEQFKGAEAVIVKSETYSKSKFTGTYPQIDQLATYRTQMHVKLLSEDAVEDYSRITIPKFKGIIGDYVQMKYVDMRIRKADGTVKDVKVRDLAQAELTEDDEMYESRDDFYIYEVEGLEVGDEVERVTILESKFADQGRAVNLYGAYPTLEAKFTLSVPSKIIVKGNVYNNMPAVNYEKTGSGQQIYEWTMTNLDAVPEANSAGTIFADKLEYFVYELNFDNYRAEQLAFKPKTFRDLLWQYSEDFLNTRGRKKKIEEFYAKLFEGKADAKSTIGKLAILNQFIATELKIIGERDLEDSERSAGVDYFLMNKKATFNVVMRIYREFFKRNEIEYYLGFGKSRFQGPVDLSFTSRTQIGGYFYVIKLDGNMYIISGTSGINELPNGFYNSTCYFYNIDDRNSELQKIDFQDVALKDSKTNKRMRRSKVQIKLGENEITQAATLNLSGTFASAGRGGMVMANKADTLDKMLNSVYSEGFKGKEVSVTDAKITKHETLPPYGFTATYNLKLKNYIKEVDGGYEINFKDWLEHNVRGVVNPENRILDYHTPYLGSDVEDFFLIFDKDVEITNADEFTQTVDNDFVSYSCKALQMNSKTIRIESRYTIKKLHISKDNAKLLDEANKAVKKVDELKLKLKAK